MVWFTFPFFGKATTKEAAFWRWFQKNQDRLHAFENDTERVFDELSDALSKVDRALCFEFGPVKADGTREFVISADGISSAFPAVEKLHSSAPSLVRWKFTKFRPRRTTLGDLELRGRHVRAEETHFLLFKDENRSKVGVMLFLPGYSKEEDETFRTISYLFLDEALGEYAVETKVGAIVVTGRDSKYFERAHPLDELARDFDAYFGKTVN